MRVPIVGFVACAFAALGISTRAQTGGLPDAGSIRGDRFASPFCRPRTISSGFAATACAIRSRWRRRVSVSTL